MVSAQVWFITGTIVAMFAGVPALIAATATACFTIATVLSA